MACAQCSQEREAGTGVPPAAGRPCGCRHSRLPHRGAWHRQGRLLVVELGGGPQAGALAPSSPAGVRDLINRLGIRLSREQWQGLVNGQGVSFADRSEAEATEIVLRADELQQSASEFESETSAKGA